MTGESILGAVAVFLAVGAVFAIAFVMRGVNQLDPRAQGTSLGFRLLILPGAVALWPYLLWRCLRRTP